MPEEELVDGKQIPILRRIQLKCSKLITWRKSQPQTRSHFSPACHRKCHGLKFRVRNRQHWLHLGHRKHTHAFRKHLYPHHLQQMLSHKEKANEDKEEDESDDRKRHRPSCHFYFPHRPFHLHLHIPHFHLPHVHFYPPHLHIPALSVLREQSKYSHPTIEKPASPSRKGYVRVYVGQDHQRFEIPILYLNHPLFESLLKKAEEEFGFDQEGPLSIPCDVSVFEDTQQRVKREKGVLIRERVQCSRQHDGKH